jgi:hypothetical protein
MTEPDTIKLLRECDAGIKMGTASIGEVLEKTTNEKLKKLLEICIRILKASGQCQKHTCDKCFRHLDVRICLRISQFHHFTSFFLIYKLYIL